MKRVLNIVSSIILLISLIIICGVNWTVNNYAFSSFDEILFTLQYSVLASSRESIISFILHCILIPILILIVILIISFILYKIFNKNTTRICIKVRSFELNINIIKVIYIITLIIPFILLVYSIIDLYNEFYIEEYISSVTETSTFIEDNYVDPSEVLIEFPEDKYNLIYIYLESMETTYADVDSGGAYSFNYIYELTKLANDYTNFSPSTSMGGAYASTGSGWTMAAMIAQTSGVPLKTLFNSDGNEEYENYEVFLPGAYSLGEILKTNGYSNYAMFGSDATFGGRRLYFTDHGDYTIYDWYTAQEEGVIEEGYYVWWGYEDEILFEYAKDKLLSISQNDEPFNFTLLTANTHTVDGYYDSSKCDAVSDNAYLNSVYCSSGQVYEFVKWIQEQDFYENTVIIIVGDHLSMNTYSFDEIGDYERQVYNVFINEQVSTTCNKNREFTTYDLYPSTLAALGATIDGDRLGLGVNLFSCEKTLTEEYGIDYLNTELNKKSEFYIDCIALGDC